MGAWQLSDDRVADQLLRRICPSRSARDIDRDGVKYDRHPGQHHRNLHKSGLLFRTWSLAASPCDIHVSRSICSVVRRDGHSGLSRLDRTQGLPRIAVASWMPCCGTPPHAPRTDDHCGQPISSGVHPLSRGLCVLCPCRFRLLPLRRPGAKVRTYDSRTVPLSVTGWNLLPANSNLPRHA